MTGNLANIILAAVSILFLGLGLFALGACGQEGGNDKSGMAGTWYEQKESGGILTVTSGELIYDWGNGKTSSPYHTEKQKDYLVLVTESDDWFYPDVYYYADEDRIIMHTMPHEDGDGGYRVMEFKRKVYVKPPEPVYGDRVDASDPAAPKDFAEHAIESLVLDVYEPTRQYGDMAPEEPREGQYHYEIRRNAKDGAEIEYAPCPEIVEITKEEMTELEELIAAGRLFELNGIDVWTEGTPSDTVSYELSISFTDGTTYHSRANHKDVDPIWEEDGWALHQKIHDYLTEAGFRYYDESFHSTKPMLRLGNGDAGKADYKIRIEKEVKEKQGTAYDYKVSTDYSRFEVEGAVPEAVMQVLDGFSEEYRRLAEQALKEDDEQMAAVPKSVWGKEDHRSTYSFYSASRPECDGMFLSFRYDEGRVNCFGLKPNGYGTYFAYNVFIDAQSGKVLSVADLFTDPDTVCNKLYERVISFGYAKDTAEFKKEFAEMVRKPATEGGLELSMDDDGVTLIYHVRTSYDEDSIYTSVEIYYDELQDLLNPAYAVMR